MILKITLSPPDAPGQSPELRRQTTIYCEVQSVVIEGTKQNFTAYYLKGCPSIGRTLDQTPVSAHLAIGEDSWPMLFVQWPDQWVNYRVESAATVPDFPGLFERR